MKIGEIIKQVHALWPHSIETDFNARSNSAGFHCEKELIPRFCDWLFNKKRYHFVGLIVEEHPDRWDLFYLFAGQDDTGHVIIETCAPPEERLFKSISEVVHAADWHEREAEDLFGLVFEGHPRLGDFILHDDAWQEGVEPMRKGIDADTILAKRMPQQDWRPRRVVTAPGVFIMPVGPVFSGEAESVHFQLETIGEEVIRAFPRLFFKYRGVEKIAEECAPEEVLLLAERFAGTAAFSHALAFCMAIERLGDVEVPKRAQVLRVFIAELERIRSHIGTIENICRSTGLAVAANQAAILEENTLRLAGSLTGHRYLFSLAAPGGLNRDFKDKHCRDAFIKVREVIEHLDELEKLLIETSSFLDRLEEVGIITKKQARSYGLVGPVARASGYCNDLRKLQAHHMYDTFNFEIPCEEEGDGYARLRILFSEVRQSLRIMQQTVEGLPHGSIRTPCKPKPGTAVAGVEAPRGASWQWVRIDEEGRVGRYRLITPSFANWHGIHMAVENFAFQDFPIILATFGLSAAENDR
jgi:formate hydrogenlyase subunit 5